MNKPMEQFSDIQVQRKVYTEKNMLLVAFLGGPLCAGYIMTENFKTFNETEKVKATWGIAIAVTALILGALFALPETLVDKIPSPVIPATYTMIAHILIQHYQKTKIADHLANGGAKHSWGRAIGVGFIGLLVTLFFVVPLIVITAFAVGHTPE
jgi:hypothetical protein